MYSTTGTDNGSTSQSQQTQQSLPQSQPSSIASASSNSNATTTAKPPKRQRACEACRRMKVQCKWNSTDASACQRCTKAQRRCILTQRRPNRHRPNADIADLERKLEALTSSLNTMRNGKGVSDKSEGDYHEGDNESYAGSRTSSFPAIQEDAAHMPANAGYTAAPYSERPLPISSNSPYRASRGHSVSSSQYHNSGTSPHPSPRPVAMPSTLPNSAISSENGPENYVDVIDQNILSLEEAIYTFNHFVRNIAPLFPIIAFAEGTTAQDIRKRRPALFLAILTASAGIWPIQTQDALLKNMMKLFSDWIIMLGEKSLDLIQALQVSSLWYHPPANMKKMNFYQLIHIAGVMAIDMNMNRRRPPRAGPKASERRGSDADWQRYWFPEVDSIEGRRAWLSCWFLGAHTAQNQKRLNILKWTPYADECIEMLETSPEAMQSDRYLCRWVRLQHIIEDVGNHFSIDDPYRNPEHSDTKIQYVVKGFEAQLQLVTNSSIEVPDSPVLKLAHEVTNLYIHEVAMHVGQSDDGLKPPYTEEMLNRLKPDPNQSLTTSRISYISTCLASINTIFDLYLSIPMETFAVLPSLHYVRLVYTVVVLIKIYLNMTMAPSGDIKTMLREEDFDFDNQLNALCEMFQTASIDNRSAMAPKFSFVLETIIRWFKRQRHGKDGVSDFSFANNVSASNASSFSVNQSSSSVTQHHPSRSNSTYMPLQMLSNAAAGATDYGSNSEGGVFSTDQPMFDYSANDINFEQMGFNLGGGDLSSYFVGNDPFASMFNGAQPNLFTVGN